MKRIISFFLCLILGFGTIMSLFGCSKSEQVLIKNAEWISLLNERFGMVSYNSDEPYFKNVKKDYEYYEDIQIAVEWEVISPDLEFSPDDHATKEFVIVTLLNAGEFCDVALTNEEKIDFAISNSFIEDNVMLKVGLKKPIQYDEALDLLNSFQTSWAEKRFDHVIEEIDFFENVKDYSDDESSAISEYKIIDNKTYIPVSSNVDILEGDIYVLPVNDENIAITSFKAKKVEVDDGYIVITNEESLDFEECVEELKVEETFRPNLLSAGYVLDENGKAIALNSTEKVGPSPVSLMYNDNQTKVQNLASASFSIGFKKGDWSVEGEIKSSSVSFKVEKKLNEKMKVFFKVTINDIEVTNDIDYSWGQLHSATSKVDYKVTVSGGVKGDFYKNEYVLAPWHSNEVNQFLKNMKMAMYSGWKDKNSPGTSSIHICSIPVASAGIITFNLNIKVKITVEGTFELAVTIDGSKGVQYKNGNVRYIKTNNFDVNSNISAKVEATPSLGFTANVLGKALIGVSVDGGLGAEIKAVIHLIDQENHLLDTDTSSVPADIMEATVSNGGTTTVEEIQKIAESQGGTYKSISNGPVKIEIDLCFDVKIYPILRIGIEEETVAGKLLKGTKIKLSCEILGSDDAFLNMHIESFSDLSSWERIKACNGKSCTKEFKPFDSVEDIETSEEEQSMKDEHTEEVTGVIDKEQLDISTYSVVLNVGETEQIEVIRVPKGYQLSEVVAYTENDVVATVDVKSGTIKAVGPGTTTIVVETNDKKFKINCTVIVIDNKKEEYVPLSPVSSNKLTKEGLYST